MAWDQKVSDRFWAKVQEDGDCWTWTAGKAHGYGYFRVGGRKGKSHFAHRWAYEEMVAEIPEGLVIDHLCRNRACVNPSHLEPVTHQVNIARGDMARANRERMAKATHCKRGHPFDEENTRYNSKGYRSCKECHRNAVNAGKRRRRGSFQVHLLCGGVITAPKMESEQHARFLAALREIGLLDG